MILENDNMDLELNIDNSAVRAKVLEALKKLTSGEVTRLVINTDYKSSGVTPSLVFDCIKEIDSNSSFNWEDENGWENDVWGNIDILGVNYDVMYGSYYGSFEIYIHEGYDE